MQKSPRRCMISWLIYIRDSMLNISEYSLRCVIMYHVQSMPRALVHPWGDLGALARQMLLYDARICIYIVYTITYIGNDLNSLIRKRPFFANKKSSFANLSRTPCSSLAEPMLSNNSSCEDSFITCQITPNYQG